MCWSICIKLVSITASVCAHGKKYVWWDFLLWGFADIYCIKTGFPLQIILIFILFTKAPLTGLVMIKLWYLTVSIPDLWLLSYFILQFYKKDFWLNVYPLPGHYQCLCLLFCISMIPAEKNPGMYHKKFRLKRGKLISRIKVIFNPIKLKWSLPSVWDTAWDFQQCGMCDQQSLRSACAYAQSDQSLC